MRSFIIIIVIIMGLIIEGCSRDTIPNTTVEDTSDNRDVLEFVERYRHAVEERNVGALLSLASPEYFDDMGTPTAQDDVDSASLRDHLARWQRELLEVRYEIRYRRVTIEQERVLVDYTYTGRFRIVSPAGDRWARRINDNRLVLARSDDGFVIVSGM